MPLPKRITPDNIIDAAVETRFHSTRPFEILNGLIYNVLKEEFQYTTRPLKTNIPLQALNPLAAMAMNIGSQSLFYNKVISVRVLPNTLVFGCLENYIGWDRYSAEIEKVLTPIWQTGYLSFWSRVGVRYVSEYINKDLKDCTKFNFTFGMPDVRSSSTFFRTEFRYQDANLVLTLNNKIPSLRQDPGETVARFVATSTIDVDAIREGLMLNNIGTLMGVLHSTHVIEKEVFFSLLDENFLQTLKPEY